MSGSQAVLTFSQEEINVLVEALSRMYVEQRATSGRESVVMRLLFVRLNLVKERMESDEPSDLC